MRKLHSSVAASAVLAFCTTIALAPFANAQDAAPADAEAEAIGDIIVTAQRRATSLQDTPLAISAFSGDTLEERGIDDLSNLQSYVPNLNIGQEQDGFKISMRGIGLQGTSTISDSGVAFYIDNFYIPRPAGGSAVFYDIDRIEVLRGPQGTLYGRNATGGVINVISEEPRSSFEGQAGMSYGSRNLWEARGMINVPFSSNVAARASAVYTEEDGYVDNISTAPGTSDPHGTDGDLTVRGQMAIGLGADTDLLLSGLYSDLNGSGVAMHFLERNIGGPPPVQVLLGTMPADIRDPLTVNNDAPSFNDTETTIAFARLTHDFGGVEFVLQAGLLEQTANVQQDFDGSPVNISIFNKDQENEAETAEFRFASNGDGPLSWIVGGYYFSEDTYALRRVRLRGQTPGGQIQLPDFLLDEWGVSTTWAGYGNATYAISDAFRVSAGVRYTEDERSGRKVTRGNFGQPFPPDIPNASFPGVAEFDQVTWRAGVEWDAGEDTLVYGTVSNGYKAGGFNLTSNGAPYEPETVDAYEFGIKSDLFDRRARINLDAFYYDYQDMQMTTLATINNAPGQLTTNAAAATIYGVELDTQFLLTSDLTLSTSYAYLNGEFEEYFNSDPRALGLGVQNLSGNKIPYVAENTFNIGLDYDVSLGGAGDLNAAVAFNWQDEMYLREYNLATIDRVPSRTRTDITLVWNVADTNLRVTGYVTNLEDDVHKNNIYISPGFIGASATTSYTRPRTVGLRIDYEF